MSHGHFIANAVVAQQQPPRQTLIDLASSIGERSFANLLEERMNVTHQDAVQRQALFVRLSKNVGADAAALTSYLNKYLVMGTFTSHEHRHCGYSFATNTIPVVKLLQGVAAVIGALSSANLKPTGRKRSRRLHKAGEQALVLSKMTERNRIGSFKSSSGPCGASAPKNRLSPGFIVCACRNRPGVEGLAPAENCTSINQYGRQTHGNLDNPRQGAADFRA